MISREEIESQNILLVCWKDKTKDLFEFALRN